MPAAGPSDTPSAPGTRTLGPADLVVANARIFDGTARDLMEGAVHVRDGRVVAVTADGDDGPGRATDTVVLDARERVVVPGLVDAHFHAYGVGLDLLEIESTPPSYLAIRAADRLGRALHRGFTTVRDVAGGDAGLARAVAEHRFPSPTYLHTGPALSQTGGHGDPHPGDRAVTAGCCNMTEVVDGVEPLRRAVRERLRSGVHAIKIMTSGGVVSPTDPIRMPQYSAAEVAAVADEATRRGSYVAAHAYSPEAIVHSVRNGVRSIEHGNLLDADAARVMAEHDAVLVPTLATYDALDRRGADLGLAPVSQAKNREVLAAGQRAIELATDAGVVVGFGTDLMGDLEDEQLQGLRLQVEVQGVLDTLRAATTGNATVLCRDDLGRIASGAVADLVVLDGDPFTEPAVLWNARRTVVQAGTVVHDGLSREVRQSADLPT
ncbi:metal-dependent hydrolase family protein [Salsipaludibacter albus]|uniref:metal-dependent hydrolase family protein n=1 Tax=Salsipaludibacter albus TaxID=2849650 RepID=UPI001EE48B23|nr:amidohydrolase family protein [Salsipaludibacter albus]MBY5164070.1 amidohydrolase family protein [Salsipaludibacter albus]